VRGGVRCLGGWATQRKWWSGGRRGGGGDRSRGVWNGGGEGEVPPPRQDPTHHGGPNARSGPRVPLGEVPGARRGRDGLGVVAPVPDAGVLEVHGALDGDADFVVHADRGREAEVGNDVVGVDGGAAVGGEDDAVGSHGAVLEEE